MIALPKAIEIHAHGSATAFEDLANGQADIGMASRKIKSEEVTQLAGLGDMTSPECEHILGLDGIAVIVSRKNPVRTLVERSDRANLRAARWGIGCKWAGQTVLSTCMLATTNPEPTTHSEPLCSDNAALAASAKRVEDSRKLSDAVAQDPNGIGFIGLTYVQETRSPRRLRERRCRALANTLHRGHRGLRSFAALVPLYARATAAGTDSQICGLCALQHGAKHCGGSRLRGPERLGCGGRRQFDRRACRLSPPYQRLRPVVARFPFP